MRAVSWSIPLTGHKARQLCDTPQARGYEVKNSTEGNKQQKSEEYTLDLDRKTHTEVTSSTHSSIKHKQSFPRNGNRDLNVFLFYLKETEQVRNPVYVCAYISEIWVWVATAAVWYSLCQIIRWTVSKLSTDTVTESRARHLPGGGATVERDDAEKHRWLFYELRCFPLTPSLLLCCSTHKRATKQQNNNYFSDFLDFAVNAKHTHRHVRSTQP